MIYCLKIIAAIYIAILTLNRKQKKRGLFNPRFSTVNGQRQMVTVDRLR